jgi:hypothetical protein
MWFSYVNTLVPSLQCFRSDPFGALRRGILTPSGLSGAGLPLSFDCAQDKLCSPSMGTPLLQQITLMDNGVPQKLRKLRLTPVEILGISS